MAKQLAEITLELNPQIIEDMKASVEHLKHWINFSYEESVKEVKEGLVDDYKESDSWRYYKLDIGDWVEKSDYQDCLEDVEKLLSYITDLKNCPSMLDKETTNLVRTKQGLLWRGRVHQLLEVKNCSTIYEDGIDSMSYPSIRIKNIDGRTAEVQFNYNSMSF